MSTDMIIAAMHKMDREHFVPDYLVHEAGFDVPLPIGYGQTISQPTTVQRMLYWLEVEPGDDVLDVGSGSGWTTALLSYITGSQGRVIAVEIVPELVEMGRKNCSTLGLRNVKFHKAGKEYGWPAQAPYDRILVSAAAEQLPTEILNQLKPGGKLVIPVQHDILEITKISENEFDTTAHQGFVFVPLV